MHDSKIVWYNGHILAHNSVNISIENHSLHYGSGVFEGIRGYYHKGQVILDSVGAHISRFFNSAESLGLDITFSYEELCAACQQVADSYGCNLYLRPLAIIKDNFITATKASSSSDVYITAKAVPVPEKVFEKRAITSNVVRSELSSHYHKIKSTGLYSTVQYSIQYCRSLGYEQAIVLDSGGYVCECLTENIFFIKDGVFYTPPKQQSMIDGITRENIISILLSSGFSVREEKFSMSTLLTAEEVFTTGTASLIQAITHVDSHIIGDGFAGEMTHKVLSLYLNSIYSK